MARWINHSLCRKDPVVITALLSTYNVEQSRAGEKVSALAQTKRWAASSRPHISILQALLLIIFRIFIFPPGPRESADIDIQTIGKKIGLYRGAGDKVHWLEQMGYSVTI